MSRDNGLNSILVPIEPAKQGVEQATRNKHGHEGQHVSSLKESGKRRPIFEFHSSVLKGEQSPSCSLFSTSGATLPSLYIELDGTQGACRFSIFTADIQLQAAQVNSFVEVVEYALAIGVPNELIKVVLDEFSFWEVACFSERYEELGDPFCIEPIEGHLTLGTGLRPHLDQTVQLLLELISAVFTRVEDVSWVFLAQRILALLKGSLVR